MRIAYYYTTPFPSLRADVVHIVEMCKNMAALGHVVTLVIPRSEQHASDQSALVEAAKLFGSGLGFVIQFIPRFTVLGRLQTLGSLRGAAKFLRSEKFDLIYTRAPWACRILPALGTSFIFEAHDYVFHKNSKLLSGYLRRAVIRASQNKNCKLIVTISDALRNVWERLGVPPEKLFVAHDAVDIELFDNSLSLSAARDQLNLSSDKPVVVYAGALYETYGIDLIFQAAQELPNLEFYLIGGSTEDLTRCRSVVANLGISNVRLIGPVPHRAVPVWLAAADMLLMQWSWRFPTMAICSPMKVFEYMAAERLIIGPAFPTITEILKHNENALLFEPDDLSAMIAALREGLNQFANSPLPRHARQTVEKDHTWRERCRKILAQSSLIS